MERGFQRSLVLSLIVVVAMVPKPSLSQTRTMCFTQLSLANQACSLLPVQRGGPKEADKELVLHGNEQHRHHHIHGHHRGSGGGGGSSSNSKHHSPLSEECCRWLKELDSACVCQVLIHLPRFLTRPHHYFSVAVDDTCEVSFECDGF